MHDDRTLVEARLGRVLDERLRPAVYPESVPLEVAVWHQLVPGHRDRARGLGRADRGGAARPRLRREHARLPVRGPGPPARRHPREGPQPPQPAVFDENVWQLVIDFEVLGELMAELPADSPRRWEAAGGGPGDRPRPGRQPPPTPPGFPEHAGRLGRRRVLAQHGHRPHRRGRGHPGRGRCLGADRPLLRRLTGHAGADAAAGGAAARGGHRGRPARDGEVPQARLPTRPARRTVRVRDAVRALLPAHPHQHLLGGRQVRGVRPPLRPPPGAGLGRGGRQRLDVRPRREPYGPHRLRYDHHGPRLPAARPALPRPRDRPGRAPLPARAGAGRVQR